MEIARRIRQVRVNRSLSLARAALEAGLQPAFLALVEEGRAVPSWENLENLAAGFRVPVWQFFFDGYHPPITPRLTPRTSLQEFERISRFLPARSGSARASVLLKAIKTILALIASASWK